MTPIEQLAKDFDLDLDMLKKQLEPHPAHEVDIINFGDQITGVAFVDIHSLRLPESILGWDQEEEVYEEFSDRLKPIMKDIALEEKKISNQLSEELIALEYNGSEWDELNRRTKEAVRDYPLLDLYFRSLYV